ncbi:acetyl-CoA:L-glutamate N-acetyltransferase [Aspergillus clavatus NRRL 1]|uniref:Amino-acid acetyltransferase, mitochondrial n=1 Tax=Aspergillus clavatus (strain ATCC 1007 / CBS 513.65 / DSM 816 / NCTC 3887 / NRRL 1 / QM 1276 / 107) TaxID=344612 RepID=NAGS_ASPCL|nr:acetylglutamate synthase [Aspergillus clavatus NRRL 1]A1C6J2.1 RecName: Full=Amino-acid acetyltransferase, mitochondrial; AltName: Full=Arginine-requiring protein 2; AltName: Full=Glutamate N-acetyltransferase; AltName: Full=N-acetylglutamate synthase; Short=AGS; Short=NAGS; Flags: Precursor [Aspergillus clavatus NRRL 1]EAW14013.1 acetylglutamate synthase [Aspergillus clavatus NRRL 1]
MNPNAVWPRTAQSSLKKHQVSLCTCQRRSHYRLRSFSTFADRKIHQSAGFSSSSKNHDRLSHRAREKLLDREFFLSLLSSASTQREAKSYLARLKAQHQPDLPQKPTSAPASTAKIPPLPSGVNLGSFYGASRSVYETPVFRQGPTPTPRQDQPERLHLALVKLSIPQTLDDTIIDGVAKTLAQLDRLGLTCCVMIDPGAAEDARLLRTLATEQADRLAIAIHKQPDSKSLRLDSVLSVDPATPHLPKVLSRKALLKPLRDGHTVILTPIAYTEDVPRAVMVSADDAVLALTRELAGLATFPDPDEDPLTTAERIGRLQKEVSLDRVILLHPLGGIPAFNWRQSSHVFINMEQEYDDIENELLQARDVISAGDANLTASDILQHPSSVAVSNPLSKFVHKEIVPLPPARSLSPMVPEAQRSAVEGHLENLRLSQKALAMLPSASSGIITSPIEVANSAKTDQPSDLSVVGTRRQRNPLIHNLLTDKPLLSSSLPMSRRGPIISAQGILNPVTSHTTFVKRGMPLTILPNPWVKPWSAQRQPRLRLDDPSIDLPRLVHLIEDSFNRKLDVQDYLNRVNDRLAGLIIAGEYEGGAILTWELPPGVQDDGSAENSARMVPYLDKFAVLKRSQGAGGVADIVFNAMVRTCFPNGVCWRSRKNNPVNKWYFERSLGTWKLSDTNWTMFWTTPGLVEDSQKFRDYEAVCRSIQPSWAEDTGVVD